VPDLYQGDELVTLSLVDPDNRRAVDWERRRTLLDRVQAGTADVDGDRDAEKLALVVHALDVRARRPACFAGEHYTPVDAGPDVCAYLRGGGILAVAVLRDAGLDARLTLPDGSAPAARELTGGRSYALVERER
jgi:(1->4)-alpha-D-glucan 1-alpha-D-glucosylmutase